MKFENEYETLSKIQTAAKFWHEVNADFETWVLLLPLSHDGDCFGEKIRHKFLSKLDGRVGVVVECAKADNLLMLYSLYAFSDKLIIGSLDMPHGRKLRNLLDCGIATEEELINDVILGCMDGAEA